MGNVEQAFVLTDRDLAVVASSEQAADLSEKGHIVRGDHLLDHFPGLATFVMPDGEAVLRDVPVRGSSVEVRVIPAGEFISFYLSGHAPGPENSDLSAELKVLREQNRHLLGVIEEAPIGIMFIDEGGRIAYMNKKQEENTRKKRETLLNRPVKSVYPKTFVNAEVVEMYERLHSKDVNRMEVLVDHYYPQFYKKDMIIKFLGYRVEELNWAVLFIEVEDELYHEKRKAEKAGEELRQSKTFLAQVLDASPNIVMSVDSKRRVLSFNKTAERLTGFCASQVFNTPVDRFFPREELPKLNQAISHQGLWFGTMNLYRFDKTTFRIELYTAKVKDEASGKDIATLLLGVDIEEQEKLRKNLIQSQKMTFIGELVSGLAHQLNNPLVGVMNIAEVLLRKWDPADENYHLLKMIHEAGKTCHETISRLLSFSRKPEMNKRVMVDIREVLRAGMDFVTRHEVFQKVELSHTFHAVPLIMGDPVLLQQVFMNILFNAAQAVDGTGRIEVTCSGVYGMGRQVEVNIADNGHGIAREDISKIFEPFYTTKKEGKGTGIGLSLVYWIVQDHGGRIEVESELQKGTTFTVYLPAILC